MRIFSFLFTSFLIFAVLGVIGALLAREVLLSMAVGRIRTSLSELHRISRDPSRYTDECRRRGGDRDTYSLARLQVRFINSKQFLVEAVCAQFQLEPVVVDQQSLPFLVNKRPGSSGIIWGEERSGVSLEIFGRKRDVYVENEEIKVAATGAITPGIFPAGTCSGYGYMCCQAETFSGTGEMYTDAQDCPRTCYAACKPRPLVLSLTADPFPDQQTRTLKIGNGETVTFSYILSYDGQEKYDVFFDFGDGQSQNLTKLNDVVPHSYQCARGTCTYTAKITAKTASGVESAITPVGQLYVTVSQ